MIDLTRLNGHTFLLNCDLIKFAEAAPDTTLSLVTGEKLVVLESCDEVRRRVLAWRAAVLGSSRPLETVQSSSLQIEPSGPPLPSTASTCL